MIRYMVLLLLLSLSSPLLANARILDLAVLEDPEGRETIQSISSPARSFRPLADNTFAGGFTRSIHWFRLRIEMPAGEWWLELLPAVLDELRLYEPAPGAPGDWRMRTTGDSFPFATREVRYRGFIFKLSSETEGLHTYYLRLQTTSTSILLPRIWAADEFADMNVRETALLTGGISVILTVFLLNLNTWLWLRDHQIGRAHV